LKGEVTSSLLENEFPLLHDLIINIPAGEKELLSLNREGYNLNLFIYATSFPILGKNMKLISVQNIKAELDDRELATWQKMIRVLTHEIMNSISPVSSTIKTIKEFLTADDHKTALQPENLTAEIITDSVKGLEIIDERSTGLKDFVQKFRSLTLLPEPEPELLDVSNVLEEVQHLMKGVSEENKIELIVQPVESEIQLNADKKLLHHVLINLINNAADALEDTKNPQIKIYALKKENNVIIKITDNGEGIHPDKIDDIFTPFFTTREKGSGIGLSVCKQIMRLHGGDISVKSTQGEGSTFVLQFFLHD
jgi:signal transduction histidine kinase